MIPLRSILSVCLLTFSVTAFTTTTRPTSRQSLSLLYSTANEEAVYPPLSQDEVQSLLDAVPLYAVTDSRQQGGLVLLKEGDNPTEIANFFLTPLK